MSDTLFTPIQVGDIHLGHRIVLAPLTRLRADPSSHIPSDLMLEYYTQRASPGGLLITEGTFISPAAGGLLTNPGIYTPAQIEKWAEIVRSVHAKGGKMVMQIYAMGRAANPLVLEKEEGGPFEVGGPSALAFEGGALPKELSVEEIQQLVRDHAEAAKNFVTGAGGDGVEFHLGNGYLSDEFLQLNSNKRLDQYGGSVVNRTRFALETLSAVAVAVGEGKVGFRITPFSTFQDMKMSQKDIEETFGYLVREAKSRHPGLAYLHLVEPRVAGAEDRKVDQGESLDFLHDIWAPKVVLVAGGLTPASAKALTVARENVVAVFGRSFLATPDLPARIRNGVPLSKWDRATFYTSGPEGYTDYPTAT
ncbi:NADPH2 dehydrogenase, partial [Phenoliferia sp. Uapishka_3]